MVRAPTEWGGGGRVEFTMVRSPTEWGGGGCVELTMVRAPTVELAAFPTKSFFDSLEERRLNSPAIRDIFTTSEDRPRALCEYEGIMSVHISCHFTDFQ